MVDLVAKEYVTFEQIKHVREDGSEYWNARELSEVLEYTEWRNFAKVIDRAMMSCINSGSALADNFVEVNKIVETGVATKKINDYELSRYACYLIVQNGDPRKEVIAVGQTYFAIQTRRQEVADCFNQLDEDRKRLAVRGDIKVWNQMLAAAANKAGVMSNEDFKVFQNAGYMGLYGGMTIDEIHAKKGLGKDQRILDFMGSTELAANLFRITQTEEKLKKDNITDAQLANEIHYVVGKEVRNAIENVGGTMPEDLPNPPKTIGDVEREQLAEQLSQLSKKKKKLMLDE
jgi:DNA-damage-inducible protein D